MENAGETNPTSVLCFTVYLQPKATLTALRVYQNDLPIIFRQLFGATPSKKLFQQSAAVVLPDSGCHLQTMIQSTVIDYIEERLGRSGFAVGEAVHQTAHPAHHQSARAHGARLQRHIQRAACQSPAA